MSNFLSLDHFQQAAEGQCLPACARMALAYLGIKLSEKAIGRMIGAKEFGTPSFAIQKLTELNLQVNYGEWSIAALLTALEDRNPVIIFVRTGFLDYWQEDIAHAVVVVGAVSGQQFWVHDPAQPNGPNTVSWNSLLAAWAEFGYRGATLIKN